jgi:hypothetical protein
MYKLELSREAQRFYERTDKSVAKKLARCFQSLETDPRLAATSKPSKARSPVPSATALAIYASLPSALPLTA